jgi:hypothetical protein
VTLSADQYDGAFLCELFRTCDALRFGGGTDTQAALAVLDQAAAFVEVVGIAVETSTLETATAETSSGNGEAGSNAEVRGGAA